MDNSSTMSIDEATEADSTPPSSSSDVSDALMRKLPTRDTINSILQSASSQTPMEALAMLAKLERRELPAAWTSRELGPQDCCFDNVALPQSSWTCNKLCNRCAALTAVRELWLQEGLSSIHHTIFASSIYLTDCTSQTQRRGVIPELPMELILHIVDCIVQDVQRSAHDKSIISLVRAFMHTSSMLRFQVVKSFQPIPLYESIRASPDHFSKVQVYMPFALVEFIWRSIRYHVQDATMRRYSNEGMPTCLSSEIMRTTTGVTAHFVQVTIVITSDALSPDRSPVQKTLVSDQLFGDSNTPLTVAHISRVFNHTIRKGSSSPTVPGYGHAPRVLTPFQRATSGSLDASSGVTFDITLLIRTDHSGESGTHFTKHFSFDSRNQRACTDEHSSQS